MDGIFGSGKAGYIPSSEGCPEGGVGKMATESKLLNTGNGLFIPNEPTPAPPKRGTPYPKEAVCNEGSTTLANWRSIAAVVSKSTQASVML